MATSNHRYQFIDSEVKLAALLQKWGATEARILFVDLEGVNLSRHGAIAIMQLLLPPEPTVYLIDVHVLGAKAFEVAGPKNLTLKFIFESERIPKCFFDVRNDSDALFHQFGVDLQCVIDVQVLEFVSRPKPSKYLSGLAKCMDREQQYIPFLTPQQQAIKENGSRLFAPEKGGSYEVFLQRPLAPAILDYCVQDVFVLPSLLLVYANRLTPEMACQIQSIVDERLLTSQCPNYNASDRRNALGPSLKPSRAEARPNFPMSLVCSSQLLAACQIDQVTSADAFTIKSDMIVTEGILNERLGRKREKHNPAGAELSKQNRIAGTGNLTSGQKSSTPQKRESTIQKPTAEGSQNVDKFLEALEGLLDCYSDTWDDDCEI